MHRRGERPEGRSASCSVLLVSLQPLAAFLRPRFWGTHSGAKSSSPPANTFPSSAHAVKRKRRSKKQLSANLRKVSANLRKAKSMAARKNR